MWGFLCFGQKIMTYFCVKIQNKLCKGHKDKVKNYVFDLDLRKKHGRTVFRNNMVSECLDAICPYGKYLQRFSLFCLELVS